MGDHANAAATPNGNFRITKTELVWPGKYDENGKRVEVPRVSLPFQVIETINESRATRETAAKGAQTTLFDVYEGKEGSTFEEGWRNKLIWGDNLLVMNSLLDKFAGKIDLIYIDPPFATGADFSFTAEIGEESLEVEKEQSIIEEKAYRDTWGKGVDSYVDLMADRFTTMYELLSQRGTIYVHCDWRVSYFFRAILDGLFGKEAFVNEIVWHYFGFKRKTARNFPRKHDTIIVYGKSDSRIWNVQYRDHRPEYVARFKKDSRGRLYRDDVNPTAGGARTIYLDEVPGDIVDSVWSDISPVNPVAAERWNYGTQKPKALLERIIKASSDPGSLVADFFCGSGTTMEVAERLNRRWIGCDLGRWAVHVSRKRLLEISDAKPFEILNLGKYERQYWQGVTFGSDKVQTQQALYEYLAFILKLYDAHPITGSDHIHGKKGSAMVHIGAVDAPVTIDEISHALDECMVLKAKELHVLGWEWEMGLAGPNNDYRAGGLMHDVAKQKGIKLILLQIPREVMEQQAVDKGDIQFFELAYLDVNIEVKKRSVVISLNDFVIPNTELIPDEVREKIKQWSDFIDYWAADWDFQNDTFIQGWVTYRTRKNRKLGLESDPHTYEKPGKYRAVIKVVDIFGNDTSQAYTIEVK